MASIFNIFTYVRPRKVIKSDDFNGLQDSLKASFDSIGEALTVLDPVGHLGVSTPLHVGEAVDNEHATTKGYVDGLQVSNAANVVAAEDAQAAAEAAAVLTAADVVSTAADVVSTAADVVSTNADVLLTAADVIAVAAIYDAFDDRYLGSKAANPTLDNDGAALTTGALYYNTTASNLRVYNGASWDTLDGYTHPNHSGDVTSTGDGATVIAANVVSNSKLAQVATSILKGRSTAGTGNVEDLTATQVRAILNVANGANAYSHPNHTGQVTSTGDGAMLLAAAAITAQTALTSGLVGTDEFLVSDNGVLKRMDVSVLAAYLDGTLNAATLDSLDSTAFLRMDNVAGKAILGNPYLVEATLTDATTVSWTPADSPEAKVTLGGNRTLDLSGIPPAPTTMNIRVIQDGTGSRTLAYSADFDFGDAGAPVLTTTAGGEDVLSFRSTGTKALFTGIAQGFA